MTAPRLVVLEALGEGRHLDVETIASQARQLLGNLSTQAVYDILGVLTEGLSPACTDSTTATQERASA